jgi:hypothetical protein
MKDDGFCLPYGSRLLMEEENSAVELLRLAALDSFTERVMSGPAWGSRGRYG